MIASPDPVKGHGGRNPHLAAVLTADVVGFSRLTGEDRVLARLRGLHNDLIDPTILVHNGMVVCGEGGVLVQSFRGQRRVVAPS